MQNPVAGILSGRYIWYLDDSSNDTLKTDSYSFAYWEHVDPPTVYQSIACIKVPCNVRNLMVVGSAYALVIADKWAMGINTLTDYAASFSLPSGMSAWSEIAGGRSLPGPSDDGSVILVGPVRQGAATKSVLSMGVDSSTDAVIESYMEINSARAGAALIYEKDVGIVIAGGSSDTASAGVERFDLGAQSKGFVNLPYPADPVVGATMVMEDSTHVLRVGGLNTDGSSAPTVRIDLECTANCAYEEVPTLDLALQNVQSFYDAGTDETLVVGEDIATDATAQTVAGQTRVYRYKSGGFVAITIPAAQQRVHALPLELPNQQLALVGGTDPTDDTLSRQDVSVIAF
jgi:hypothetical protein